MPMSRKVITFIVAIGAVSATQATDAPVFAVVQTNALGQATVFESTAALKKGDVIKIRANNAQLVSTLGIAMCNADCPTMHMVKAVPLSYMGQPVSDSFVLPEDGRVAIAMQNNGGSPQTILGNGGTLWNIVYVGPFASSASAATSDNVVPANSYNAIDGTLRARFDHRTFVTVSVAGTGT
jgi:hypothetical protein